MNYIDLFHGIGGFALGAYWAGMKFENHFCSDIEPYAQELYKLRFPDSIQLGDITRIDTQELKNKYSGEWIITGGFPCQDISIAGKGAGIHGERSGLWFEYWRLINDLRPRFAIMENVGMLVHRGLREVLGSLAEIGYDAEWQDIRAEDMGAPHKRERIWIVAYTESTGAGENNGRIWQGISGIDRREKADREIPDTHRFDDDNSGHGAGAVCGERSETTEIPGCMADNNCKRCEKLNNGITERTGNFNGCNAGREETWSIEPDVGRLAHGIPRRVDRLKGLGNSIVPQIAEILFRQIKELL